MISRDAMSFNIQLKTYFKLTPMCLSINRKFDSFEHIRISRFTVSHNNFVKMSIGICKEKLGQCI